MNLQPNYCLSLFIGTIRCRLQKDLHLLGIAKLINNIIAQHYFEHDGDALFCISVGSGSESRRSPAKLPGTSAKDIDVYTDSVALKTQFSVGNFNDELSIYLATGRKSEPKGLISGFPCTITELKHRYRKIGMFLFIPHQHIINATLSNRKLGFDSTNRTNCTVNREPR